MHRTARLIVRQPSRLANQRIHSPAPPNRGKGVEGCAKTPETTNRRNAAAAAVGAKRRLRKIYLIHVQKCVRPFGAQMQPNASRTRIYAHTNRTRPAARARHVLLLVALERVYEHHIRARRFARVCTRPSQTAYQWKGRRDGLAQ